MTAQYKRYAAVLFDLDGTLVDSEAQTDASVAAVLGRYGVPDGTLPPSETRGRSWIDIARAALARYRVDVPDAALADALAADWIAGIDGMVALPGAARALEEAARHLKVAIVSSSPRSVIDAMVARLGASAHVPPSARIGADQVERHKPDPQGFLLAAERFGVASNACIVVEDSTAGLEAARTAGMGSLAVLACSGEPALCRALASASFRDYEALPRGFWKELAEGARALSGEWS